MTLKYMKKYRAYFYIVTTYAIFKNSFYKNIK